MVGPPPLLCLSCQLTSRLAGNEADVTLYLEHTGLMWENAEAFGALLVFAEHRHASDSSFHATEMVRGDGSLTCQACRYYGASKPYRSHPLEHLQYLTSEQALPSVCCLPRRHRLRRLRCTVQCRQWPTTRSCSAS